MFLRQGARRRLLAFTTYYCTTTSRTTTALFGRTSLFRGESSFRRQGGLFCSALSSPSHPQQHQQQQQIRSLYQHGYHAGSFADVTKHSILIAVLQHLLQGSSKGLSYVETHAGAGLYPLDFSPLREHQRGMELVLSKQQQQESDAALPKACQTLVKIMYQVSPAMASSSTTVLSGSYHSGSFGDEPIGSSTDATSTEWSGQWYPGSAMIASKLCRPSTDELILCEKAEDQFHLLVKNLRDVDDSNDDEDAPASPMTTLLHNDGYKVLRDKNFLQARERRRMQLEEQPDNNAPIPPRRAFLFMDPPYETGSDTDQIGKLVQHLAVHWKAARIGIWYPIKHHHPEDDAHDGSKTGDYAIASQRRTQRLLDNVRKHLKKAGDDAVDCLAIEVYSGTRPEREEDDDSDEWYDSDDEGDNRDVGTGMLLIKPPYGIRQELEQLLPQLCDILDYNTHVEENETSRDDSSHRPPRWLIRDV